MSSPVYGLKDKNFTVLEDLKEKQWEYNQRVNITVMITVKSCILSIMSVPLQLFDCIASAIALWI